VQGIVRHALVAIVLEDRDHRIGGSGVRELLHADSYCQFVLVMGGVRISIDYAARYGYVDTLRSCECPRLRK
jgi:methanogenic corrinoid protein MtbC1